MRRRRSGAVAASAASSGGTSAFISLHILHMGFDPGREVQKKYGKCTKINDPANSVFGGRVPNIPCSRQRALPGPLSRPPPLSGPPPPPDPHLHFLTRRPPPLPSAHKLPFLVFLPYIDPVPYPVLTQCRTMPYTSPLVGFVSKLMPFSGLMMPISCLKMGALKIL